MIQIRFKPSCTHCLPLCPPSLGLLSLSFSIWDVKTWWKVTSLNGILRKLLLGIYVILARGTEQMCLPVSQGKENASPRLGLEPVGVRRLARSLSAPPQGTPCFPGWDDAGKLQVFCCCYCCGFFFFFWISFFLALLWCLEFYITARGISFLKCFKRDYLIQWNDAMACKGRLWKVQKRYWDCLLQP